MKFFAAVLLVGCVALAQRADGFTLPTRTTTTRARTTTTPVSMAARADADDEQPSAPRGTSSRRDVFARTVTAAATTLSLFVDPAWAVSGEGKVNAKLQGFGLPTLGKVPDGFSPLLEVYGKGKNRSPLLVTFSHPLTWVVTLPSNTVNGEDGTIQAGDYGKKRKM